jgi:RNA polymerase sigma factor (sigma-70 family)
MSDLRAQRVFIDGMSDERTLLAEYAAGSEAAFRELVERYINLVYSAALRLVDGDAHMAQDVAQTVFFDLARAAASLSSDVRLGGWLHRHTCFVAAKMMRAQRRRELREQEAAHMNAFEHQSNFSDAAQLLDTAINQLGASDRAAILLRFFEGLDFRAIGAALGSNEAAAQKRVSRALEKLNRLLTKKGVKLTGAALAAALSAQAVSAAPIGLASNIAAGVLLATPESASAFSLIKLMMISKSKAAAMTLLLAAAVSAPIIFNRPAAANIADLQKNVSAQTSRLLALARENRRLETELAKIDRTAASERDEFSKLSSEARALRQNAEKIKTLRDQIRQVSYQREGGNQTIWQNTEFWRVKQERVDAWGKAFYAYAAGHDGKLPSSFAEAEPYFPKDGAKGAMPPEQEYEILYSGSLQALTNLNSNEEFLIFRQRKLAPLLHWYDGSYWNKMGRNAVASQGPHAIFLSVPDGLLDHEFSDWEKAHLVQTGVQ